MGIFACRVLVISPIFLYFFIAYLDSAICRQHHIRHYKERFKRQHGENLYLPDSYVTDSDEPDEGPWGEWSAPSACSRSCGGGVSTQIRECIQGYTCRGSKNRYISCNTQDCPDDADFRAQQCSEFDKVPFDGILYQWVPYTKAPNQCELNCMPKGERFYYRHKMQVLDGTRCNDWSPDVCIQGKCKHVGCDMMLGSPAEEDKCRKCGGDGSTCNTLKGRYDKQDLTVGYNSILLIPRGATNIIVQEVEASNNYLAIRNTSGHYYLNGNYRIDYPRLKEFAGAFFNYERFPQELTAPDKITCLGPTTEPLIVMLLFQEKNVGIEYEYSVPSTISASNNTDTFSWTFDPFNPCSKTCGGGLQYRNVTCVSRQNLSPVESNLCDLNTKPAEVQECNKQPCQANWVPYPWGPCSAPCGGTGVQTREISCQQMDQGTSNIISDDHCQEIPKPETQKPCSRSKVCPKWHIGPWKPCDHLCGDGIQKRKVRCFIKNDNKIEIVDDAECSDEKPEEIKACNLRPCEGVDWIVSGWSGCDKCDLTNETRKVQCASINGKIYPDHICQPELKPETVRKCNGKQNENCEYRYYASQWSECSAKCGQGVQTRVVFCGTTNDKNVVKKVDDAKCDQTKKYETIQNCTAEQETCGGEWFSGPWSECSKKCGGGFKTRKVVCLLGNEVVNPDQCDIESIVFAREDCNKQACSEDTIMPIDSTVTINESDATSESDKITSEISVITDEITSKSSFVTMDSIITSEITTDLSITSEITTENSSKASDETTMTTDDSKSTTELNQSTSESSDQTTESSDLTPEFSGSTSETPKTDDEEYEYVQSTECDDGEWVDADTHEPIKEKVKVKVARSISKANDPYIELEKDKVVEKDNKENALVKDELMLSDAPQSPEINPDDVMLSDGSGSGDSSTKEDIIEGSGFSSTTTDISSSTTDIPSTIDTESTSTILSTTSKPPRRNKFIDLYEVDIGKLKSETTTKQSLSTDDAVTSTTDLSTEATEDVGGTSDITTEQVSGSTKLPGSTEDVTDGTDNTVTTDDTGVTSIATENGSTDSSTYTDITGETEGTSESGPTETTGSGGSSEATTLTESTLSTTEYTGSTLSTTEYTGSTLSTTEYTGSTLSTTEYTGSTLSTIEDTGSTSSTTEYTGSTLSTTEDTGSTSSTTEYTGSTLSTTEYTGSTLSTTEYTGSTLSTTEYTGSTPTEVTVTTTESTYSSTTEYTDSTNTDMWGSTTPLQELFKGKSKVCKRPKKPSCHKSKHGCCWDNITPAKGPFDEGCSLPKTCKESKFGCCEDGVSAALSKDFKGCPKSDCGETLFGCCPDNRTPAEGNDNEGCPPPPPACLKSKYGCCEDNVTEAKGEKGKGCKPTKTTSEKPPEDCNNSTYGCCPDNKNEAKGADYEGCDIFKENCDESYFKCCPDGKTSAKGPNYKGCEMPCSNSMFGCCSDGQTPAHGPNGEGCCLINNHGCCPDNITPAKGPRLEGCGCEYSPYGCCPDNRTSARGHNNQGCGCKYGPYGCCPDDITEAKGAEYLGCPCNTFQFGCCPDGVTPAKGVRQLGCSCRDSQYGCCSDELTNAKGPNQEGCTCETSKFGCCMDGENEAKGENFEGCEEVPINMQESCSLKKERGSCVNYTVKWFFDTDYGGCSRFWYGGCDGNGNRFKSKEECDGACVNPQGADRCKLPKISGPCEGYYVNWYFNMEKGYCEQFVYGGCLGNNNRFETLDECNQLCVRNSETDPCDEPKTEGTCRGNFPRWYYDKESSSCQQFTYGGCKGNRNNFQSLEACEEKCTKKEDAKETCRLPKTEGNCGGKEARWYFELNENRCIPFYYTGCNGNENNFVSQEACESECPKQIEKDKCHLPADTGECANYTDRYYYDTKERTCRHFYYGGCGGNDNNFLSESLCQRECILHSSPITDAPSNTEVEPVDPDPFITEYCFEPSLTGECRALMPRYFYDKIDGVCKPFTYGGCHGNHNNFETAAECYQKCSGAQDLCSLPPIRGSCDGNYIQYYYDASTDNCKPFDYGGCGGNYNRFSDVVSCQQRCRRAPPIVVTNSPVTQKPEPQSTEVMCSVPVDPGTCQESHPAFFYDRESQRCTPFTYSGCGGNHNRYQSEEQCERLCGRFVGQDVCQQEKDPGPCNYNYPKYYYNRHQRKCTQFIYGGCEGNGNRFSSQVECESLCLTHSEISGNQTDSAVCTLPVDQGTCEGGYNKRWYFNNERGECLAFIYTGCGGNFNNFKTFQSCINTCKDYLTQTEPSQPNRHPCQTQFERCETLRCQYGIEAYVDENNCNSCRCHEPCLNVQCGEGTKCAIDFNRNRTTAKDPSFIAICRQINKEGHCPAMLQSETSCSQECENDADCALDLKCCYTSCGTVCAVPLVREPSALVTQPSVPIVTDPLFKPPQVNEEEYKPEVTGELGGHVTLNCAIKGNPTPAITWSKDGFEIDGSKPRYRIKLDQSLQIITLYSTDSGIYLCTADNNLGEPIVNQIKLDVIEPTENHSASVLSDDVDPNMVVSLNAPATLNCYALGFPLPAITWWKDDVLIPMQNSKFQVHPDFSLLIHSIQLSDLGIYTCQAYNGIGKAASWAVTVKAKGPYHQKVAPEDVKYLKYLISEPETPPTYIPPYVPTPKYVTYYTEPDPNIIGNENTENSIGNEYIVPIRVNLTIPQNKYPVGSDIELLCDIQGYPSPQVSWYKDGVPLISDDRVKIEGNIIGNHILRIKQSTQADSGIYECEAINSYSRSSSSGTVLVQGMYIHPNCTDNRRFANCALIVQSKFCSHKYYAKFCCRSCTEAGLLPVDGPHLPSSNKNSALRNNLV